MIGAFLIGFLVGVGLTTIWFLGAESKAYDEGFENGKWSARHGCD